MSVYPTQPSRTNQLVRTMNPRCFEQFHDHTTTTNSSTAAFFAEATIVAAALCLPSSTPSTVLKVIPEHAVDTLTASASSASTAASALPTIPASDCVSSSAAIATPSACPDSPARVRPLLSSIQTDIDTMAASAVIDTAPDSPPELTTAASSQSSSFASSVRDEPGGENDVSHFEDISLEDVSLGLSLHGVEDKTAGIRTRRIASGNAASTPMSLVTPRYSSTGGVVTNKGSSSPPAAAAPRELMVRKARPGFPALRTQINHVVHDRRMMMMGPAPSKRPPIRGFTSPSAPSLHAPRRFSRSISPSMRLSRAPTSRSSTSVRTSPTSGHASPGETFTERRQSWQAGRKTVQELEDEYHDSDDELPEDVVIWNIPLSPRPMHERSSSHSPERLLVSPRHESAPQIYIETPETNPKRTSVPPSFPTSPLYNNLPREEKAARAARTRSWANALSDLSIEARRLTAALEDHASNQDRLTSLTLQSRGRGTKSARTSTEKRPSTAVIELPPIQKTNNLIDPLPISKEKAAVLTRTRPSWLPPKSQKEEQRHLREYQAMMTAARVAEERRADKLKQEQREREDQKKNLSRVWEESILPRWETAVREPQTRELWWQGVTPRSRSRVWSAAIGNSLGLTTSSYTAALDRAKAVEQKLAALSPDAKAQAKETRWFTEIDEDARGTFPELKIFQQGAPLETPLKELLKAYAVYRSDVGYVRGTHLVAALLLLNLAAADAFIALANLLNRPAPSAFLSAAAGSGARENVYGLVMQTLAYKRPQLHAHLTDSLSIQPADFVDPWIRSLFADLGVDCASRVMDVYVFEGDKALVRTAVGRMMALEGKLYGEREEVLKALRTDGVDAAGAENSPLREDEFVRWMREAGKVDKRRG